MLAYLFELGSATIWPFLAFLVPRPRDAREETACST